MCRLRWPSKKAKRKTEEKVMRWSLLWLDSYYEKLGDENYITQGVEYHMTR